MTISDTINQKLLFDYLGNGIKKGTLHIVTPAKEKVTFTGDQPGREVEMSINDWKLVQILIRRGDIGLGEAYADGLWDTNNLEDLYTLFIQNLDGLEGYASGSFLNQLKFRIANYFIHRNNVRGSRHNIQSHYDVGNAFYKLWLDPTMTYSSALFDGTDIPLEEAQKQKYHRILNHIEPSRKHILEIGCGWGGFAQEAMQNGHSLTGLTLSNEQHAYASQRLDRTADIRLEDYRHTKGTFDSIVSIEMFEAVGKQYWPNYFSTIKSRLAKDGIAMIQTIIIRDDLFNAYQKSSDYIRHYVFPGGFLPSPSAFKQSAVDAGLLCKDVYSFGQDYARTLREWLSRFDAQISAIRDLGYNESFIRSWRLYLSMCAASFACERTDVVQVKLIHG